MGLFDGITGFIGRNAGTIADVGRGVTGMAGAATENRGEANKEQLTRDSIAASAARDYENALQQRAKLVLDQQEAAQRESADAYKQALYSALAKNMQDVSFDRSGFRSNVPDIHFSGGSRPSALGEEGRQAAALMNNQALQRLMNPSKPAELPEVEKFTPTAPKEAGFWESLAGPAGGIMGTVGSIMERGGKAGSVAKDVAGVASKFAGGAAAALPALAPGVVTAAAPTAGILGTAGSVPLGALAGGGGAAGAAGGGGAATGAAGAGLGALGTATLIGAPIAIGAMIWKANRNDTKVAREDFAKEQFGMDLGTLYSTLETMGPEGEELARIGRSVIGKKDSDANARWMPAVQQFMQKRRAAAPVRG